MNRHWCVCPKNCITDFISSISTQFSHHLVPLKCNKSAIKRAQFRGFGRDRASKILAIFTTASNRSRPRAVHTNTHQPNVTQPALIYVPKVVKMDHKNRRQSIRFMHSLLRLSTDNPQANCASGLHFLLSNYTSENNYKKKNFKFIPFAAVCHWSSRSRSLSDVARLVAHVCLCISEFFFLFIQISFMQKKKST